MLTNPSSRPERARLGRGAQCFRNASGDGGQANLDAHPAVEVAAGGMFPIAKRRARDDLIVAPPAAAQHAADLRTRRGVLAAILCLVRIRDGSRIELEPRTEQAPRPLLHVPRQV